MGKQTRGEHAACRPYRPLAAGWRNLNKWEFPLFSFPTHFFSEPKSGISHSFPGKYRTLAQMLGDGSCLLISSPASRERPLDVPGRLRRCYDANERACRHRGLQ